MFWVPITENKRWKNGETDVDAGEKRHLIFAEEVSEIE
jgi:hypothetical protein